MLKVIGGRKVLFGILILTVGIIIDFTFGLSQNLLTLMMYTGAGFFLGNGIEHVATAVKDKKTPGIAQEEVSQAIRVYSQQLLGVTNQVQAIQESVELTNKAVSAIIDRLKK